MFAYIRSAAFIIVVTEKLVLQQSKSVTAKCTETLSPPPSIQYLLGEDQVKVSNRKNTKRPEFPNLEYF